MKYNTIIFFTIFMLIIFSVKAQKEFKEGYIINKQNDTIYGFIDFRNDYLNCNKCVFKENVDEEDVTYLPGDIKAYRFKESKYYVSSYLNDLGKDVFLEYLIDGIVDVYYYKDITDMYYYVQKENADMYQLKNDEKEVEIGGNKYIKASNEYIGILKYLFKDSRMTIDKVDNVKMSHKSLINIANNYHYNVCNNKECIVFEKKMPPVRFEFSAFIFGDYTYLGIVNEQINSRLTHTTSFDYESVINSSFGLGISTYLPRLNKRVSIYLQVLYCENTFNSSYSDVYNWQTINYYANNSVNYLCNSLGIKYTFPESKLRPELILAWASNITLSTKSERVIENLTPETNFYNIKVFDVMLNGITLGAGIQLLKIDKLAFDLKVQYTYLYKNDFSVNEPEIKLKTFRLGIGIKF